MLETSPIYKSRFDKVWMWSDWARENNVRDEFGSGGDRGIDIVAREHAGGRLCAVQCKCYTREIAQKDVDSFIAAGKTYEKYGFSTYILAHTSSLNPNATDKLEGAGCQFMTRNVLNEAINWDAYPEIKEPPPVKNLRDYQQSAFDDVVNAMSKGQSRGKMIMACGTGKTLVALRIAEKMVGKGGLVLYLVPSISLIQQSMREWADNAKTPFHYMAVCSDRSVARRLEQGTASEIEVPVTTDSDKLVEKLCEAGDGRLNVIFSTYNSIRKVKKAIKDGRVKRAGVLGKDGHIHMVFCDEAHRTTGVDEKTPAKNDDDDDDAKFNYTDVHDDSIIPAAKRLYMTATPRVYTDNVKGKAEQQQKEVISMDDESVYGRELHNLTFYDAVHKYDALCDFKVRIAYMDGDTMDALVQKANAGDNSMLPLDEKSLMAAMWDGIQRPDGSDTADNGTGGNKILQRVIMFCDMINSSKLLAGDPITYKKDVRENQERLERAMALDEHRAFARIVDHVKDVKGNDSPDQVEVMHVDGGHNAAYRRDRLEWLGASERDSPDTCRVLSNARCLSEGVDVPALDGVVFVNPRKSVVDVVQAVGRVMRKAPGKKLGYVILPVAIPLGMSIDDALNDNEYFKVVWQVLNALRSHDPMFAEEINRLELDINSVKDNEITNRIIIRHAHGHWLNKQGMPESKIIRSVATRMVHKVGDVNYYDKYGKKLGSVSSTIEGRIKNKADADPGTRDAIKNLTASLKGLINDSVTEDMAVQVLAQHTVLARVFDMLFDGRFASSNPISIALDGVSRKIVMRTELADLEDFYDDVRREVSAIDTREARQGFIRKIYGNFLESADKKGAERHGVVYTPVEIIDFMIHSVQHILKTEFSTGFNDRQVKVLDPFTGTGTFITRLLESGLITDNLYEKYKHDLHANEMILLAYYVSSANIEATYASLRAGGKHVPFDGINLADTLDLHPKYRDISGITGVSGEGTQEYRVHSRHAAEQSRIDQTFVAAHSRIRNQKRSHLHVIISNPPYSAGQKKYDDQNQNIKYPELDKRIEQTYVSKINSKQKRSLYDSYIRSIRWASDRIGDSGVIAFITNAGFLRSDAGAGVRACLADEFNEIWCFDLRGNQRTQGEISKKEGGKIFGSGSRAPVAITILVKNPKKNRCTIHYKDIGDYLSREQKLDMIKNVNSMSRIKGWKKIKPDRHHDWLDQRTDNFYDYHPIGKVDGSSAKTNVIFGFRSPGTATSRDVWVYNHSKDKLQKHMKRHIEFYNDHVGIKNPPTDTTRGTWSGGLAKSSGRHGRQQFTRQKIRVAMYRPFFKQHLYFDNMFNSRMSSVAKFFPKPDSENLVICVPYKFTGEFYTFVSNIIPDLELVHHGQCLPLYTYAKDGSHRRDNITDTMLETFQKFYKNYKITKNHIFEYVYGMLHHPAYKTKFASNLNREIPRIPFAPDFWAFCNAGKELMDLHLNYETGTKYDLGKPKFAPTKFTKLAFGTRIAEKNGEDKRVRDTTVICGDEGNVIFSDIPKTNYRINGKMPLEWMIDRYNRKYDKDSGIVNDPLECMTGQDVIDMIRRLVHVGQNSDRIISKLPKEFEPKDWDPSKAGLDVHANGNNSAQSRLA